jgi:hypothetical protein
MTRPMHARAFIVVLLTVSGAFLFAQQSPCPDLVASIESFYDANDSSLFAASVNMLTDDITLASWSEGVNGHHMIERHSSGKDQVQTLLGSPGLRRFSGRPDGMMYVLTEEKASGDRVTFLLRPDRLRPNGKRYNSYRVDAVFMGCRIRSLTVVELIGWL